MRQQIDWESTFVVSAAAITLFGGIALSHAYGEAVAYRVMIGFLVVALLVAANGTRKIIRSNQEYQRAKSGRCPECGYDLRASSDRCPECGATPPPGWPIVGMPKPLHPVTYALILLTIAGGSAYLIMLHTAARQSGH